MARTPKPSGQSRRKSGIRQPLSVFVFFAEGEVTERDYFDPVRAILKNSRKADIKFEACGSSPSTLVEKAIRYRDRMAQESADNCQLWCIFDVEAPQAHADLDRAMSEARKNDIKLAISNPCFELWLILHYQDQKAHINTDDAVALRGLLDGSTGKRIDSSLYANRLAEAISRAKELNSMHMEHDRRVPDNNPSSDVYLLFQAMGLESL